MEKAVESVNKVSSPTSIGRNLEENSTESSEKQRDNNANKNNDNCNDPEEEQSNKEAASSKKRRTSSNLSSSEMTFENILIKRESSAQEMRNLKIAQTEKKETVVAADTANDNNNNNNSNQHDEEKTRRIMNRAESTIAWNHAVTRILGNYASQLQHREGKKDIKKAIHSRNAYSIKVVSSWKGGDLFLGKVQREEDDDNVLGFPYGRWWGGGGGKGLARGYSPHDEPVEFTALVTEKERKKRTSDDAKTIKPEAPEEYSASRKNVLLSKMQFILSLCGGGQAEKEVEYDTDDESDLVLSLLNCRVPFLCCTVTHKVTAALVWLTLILLSLSLFCAGAYYAIALPNVEFLRQALWKWFCFFGVVVFTPLASSFLVYAVILAIRLVIQTQRENEVKKSTINNAFESLFFLESLKANIVRTLFLLFWLLAFGLLFQNYPANDVSWANAYFFTLRTIAFIFVWSAGTVLSQYIALNITRSINQKTLGERVRNLLRDELIIMRLSGLRLAEEHTFQYRLSRDAFSRDDPSVSHDLAQAILKGRELHGFVSRAGQRHALQLRTEREGKLMGAMVFINGLRAAQRRDERERRVERVASRRDESLFVKIQQSNLAYLNLMVSEKITKFAVVEAATRVTNPYGARNLTVGYPKRFLRKEDVAHLISETQAGEGKDSLPCVELDEVWAFFSPDRAPDIALRKARMQVASTISARSNLKTTFSNAYTIVKTINAVVSVIINFFVVLIALAIYGLDVLQLWLGISSIVIGFSFVFGNALAGMFESAIFLFGIHPYDVGDKILVGPTEEIFYVDKISLLSTQLSRWDGAAFRFFNTDLMKQSIINVRNSGNFQWMLHFFIDAATLPSRKELETIQSEMEAFLGMNRGSYNARDVKEGFIVRLSAWFSFAYQQLDLGRINRDKSRIIDFMVNALRKRKVRYSGGGLGVVDLVSGQKGALFHQEERKKEFQVIDLARNTTSVVGSEREKESSAPPAPLPILGAGSMRII